MWCRHRSGGSLRRKCRSMTGELPTVPGNHSKGTTEDTAEVGGVGESPSDCMAWIVWLPSLESARSWLQRSSRRRHIQLVQGADGDTVRGGNHPRGKLRSAWSKSHCARRSARPSTGLDQPGGSVSATGRRHAAATPERTPGSPPDRPFAPMPESRSGRDADSNPDEITADHHTRRHSHRQFATLTSTDGLSERHCHLAGSSTILW
jgi:hypothetical protein